MKISSNWFQAIIYLIHQKEFVRIMKKSKKIPGFFWREIFPKWFYQCTMYNSSKYDFFPVRISNLPVYIRIQPAELVTFTEQIISEKFHFLCGVIFRNHSVTGKITDQKISKNIT